MILTLNYDDKRRLSTHFAASEFRCKCAKQHEYKVDEVLITRLEELFTELDCSMITVNSGFRCTEHDISVGGGGKGQHTVGKAADIICYDRSGAQIDSRLVCIAAQKVGFHGIARINATSTHVDTRDGKWFGDETEGSSYCIPCADFNEYFGIPKESKPLKQGIDISYCQTQITWQEVKSGFAIIKAGQRDFTDPMYESHYKGAKSAGIPVGAYWYLDKTTLTVDGAVKEADEFVKRLAGKQFEYPVFLDLEEQKQFDLGKEKVSAMIRAFLSHVEKAGYWVGLYMSKAHLDAYVESDIKSRYCIWVAQWDVQQPTYSGAYGLWQYSSKGKINGIKGDVDMDYSYQDYPTKIKAKGLNGYGKPIEKPPEPAADTSISVEVTTADGQRYSGKLNKV